MQATSLPTTIYLLRHGRTEHNASARLMGHRDVGLDVAGLDQAATAAGLLATRPVQAVYSSDLQRARHTAEFAARRLGLEVVTHPGLREIDVGRWEGLTDAEIQRTDPEGYAAVGADPWGAKRPAGESYGDMAERVWGAIEEIVSAHPGGQLLIVSHGGPMRAVICRVLDLPWTRRHLLTFQNCGLLALICEQGTYRLEVPGWAAVAGAEQTRD